MADNPNTKVVTLRGLECFVSEIQYRFQPKGNYITTEQADEQIFKKLDTVNVDLSTKADKDSVYTKLESDDKYQVKGEYLKREDLDDYLKKSEYVPTDLTNYATKKELSDKANKDSVYTKEKSDDKYQLKGDYVTLSVLEDNYLKKSDKIDLADYATKVYVDDTFQPKGNYTTIAETDTKYQPKGDYITSSTVDTKIVNSLTNFAEKSYVENKIKEVVGTAPEALDTLQELATALNNDKDFATTITNQLADKADKSDLTNLTSSKADKSDVYTKKQADDTFLKKTETPSLNGYLSKSDADTTYQPKGSYALTSDLKSLQSTVEEHTISLSQVYTKDDSDKKYQLKGAYLTLPEASDLFQPIGDYVKISSLDNKADKSDLLTKANVSDVYTIKQADSLFLKKTETPSLNGYLSKSDADNTYQPKGSYVLSSDVYTKKQADDTFLKKTETPSLNGYLSKSDADTTYQPKGSYALTSDLKSIQSTITNELATKADKSELTSATSGKANISDVYTKKQAEQLFLQESQLEAYTEQEIKDIFTV